MFVYHFQRIVSYLVFALSIITISILLWKMVPKSAQKNSLENHIDVFTHMYKSSDEFKFSQTHIEGIDNNKKNVAWKNKLNYNIHIFYYAWYGNPEFDGQYIHWNHPILPSWREKNHSLPLPRHKPPSNIGAAFYPRLGPYSSRDVNIVQKHMMQIKEAGVGVISVSWYPPNMHDDQGVNDPSLITLLLDQAHLFNLKVCLHIEPFKNRSVETMREALKFIMTTYAQHPAYYKYFDRRSGRTLPLYYIYDSYLLDSESWARLLRPVDPELSNNVVTVRGTDLDGIFIGLVVERKHLESIKKSGFDGFYTYFGADTFTFGSNPINWMHLSGFAQSNNLLFIPSVAPGYNDERVRPWNKLNSRVRRSGDYYENSFRRAVASSPAIISITSFNEWHEGTQIEEAVPFQSSSFKYLDYLPNNHDHYLKLTSKWSFKFFEKQILLSSFS